jgi:large subunit ribosomal protein L15
MNLHSLKAPANSRRPKKRVGRGQGSGLGKTAGRGGKGQKARSGNMHFEGFEGGQSPLHRRLPKRGFRNPFNISYAVINLSDLEKKFEAGASVDEAALRKAGLVNGVWDGVKVLGNGELKKKLTVKANSFSAKAKEAISAAGGSVDVIVPKVFLAKKAKAKKPAEAAKK